MSDRVTVRTVGGFGWFTFWLFTIGITNADFGKGFLELFFWPYYIGQVVAHAAHLV